jgi:hypothetical protein
MVAIDGFSLKVHLQNDKKCVCSESDDSVKHKVKSRYFFPLLLIFGRFCSESSINLLGHLIKSVKR